jgi:small subunit ribosomal protein S11
VKKPIRTPKRKKGIRVESTGIASIYATFNNTIVSIADTKGNVLCWSSAGRIGFKGTKKCESKVQDRVAKRQSEPCRQSG